MCDANTDEDQQQQADELCALQAIYGDEYVTVDVDAASYSFAIPERQAQPHMVLRVHLPPGYPSQHPPIFELSCQFLPGDFLTALAADLEAMFAPGEVVLYNWIEHLRERWASIAAQPAAAVGAQDVAGGAAGAAAAAADEDEALAAELQAAELLEAGESGGGGGELSQQQQQQQRRRQRGAADLDEGLQAAMAEVAESVVHGEPLTEKRSTFQAHLAPASSMQHVEALMELLLQNNKIRGATHNVMAYRIEQAAKATFLQDYDDDGESAAGGRLLHLLQMVDARNVCVVVSRWYGGILLGPARFTHINNAARRLLDASGYIASSKDGSSGGSKGGGKKAGKKP